MNRVAQLLLSSKYYGVILAITHAANIYDIEPQIFIHAQQKAAEGVTVFQGLDVGESFDPDFKQSIPIDL